MGQGTYEGLTVEQLIAVADSALVDGDMSQAAEVLADIHSKLVGQGARLEVVKAAEKARNAAEFETVEAAEVRIESLREALMA